MSEREVERKESPVIVYIASASRSGSTLLDMTLGSLPGVCSVGEMRRLRSFAVGDKTSFNEPGYRLDCTCGVPVQSCRFWQEIENRSGLSLANNSFSSEASSGVRRLLQIVFFVLGPVGVRGLAKSYPPFAAELAVGRRCFVIYNAISDYTGATIIIDSSKMIYHYLVLKATAPKRVRLIALVRDGRAVAKSMIKGQRKNSLAGGTGTFFERAVRVWRRANGLILFFLWRTAFRERHLLRYEDFCGDYQGKAKEILKHFALVTGCDRWTAKSGVYHNIGGTPSRFGHKAGRINLDEAWRKDITPEERRQFRRLGGWLNRLLGYED